MAKFVTCTYRDVLSEGFLLEGSVSPDSVDAVFLDLPSPHMAVKHAH